MKIGTWSQVVTVEEMCGYQASLVYKQMRKLRQEGRPAGLQDSYCSNRREALGLQEGFPMAQGTWILTQGHRVTK